MLLEVGHGARRKPARRQSLNLFEVHLALFLGLIGSGFKQTQLGGGGGDDIRWVVADVVGLVSAAYFVSLPVVVSLIFTVTAALLYGNVKVFGRLYVSQVLQVAEV